MTMKRDIEKKLYDWKNSAGRKPLILQGARQVGKTYTLKEFGKSAYEETYYFNFEEDPGLDQIFQENLNPERIIKLLSLYSKRNIKSENTLIIFDEIQESNRALNSLKYFCENAPEYHIAAAGSLLGVLLSGPRSFPVGKVNLLKLHPLTFLEFLDSIRENNLRELIETWESFKKIPDIYGGQVAEFDPLEWMAALVSHIPDRGAQTVHYYGHYSNATRGRLKKEDSQPEYHIIEDDSPRGLNKSWARLIQKIYEVDPLVCPICKGKMRIIAFIEDYKVVKKILDYLGIYEFERKRPPPKVAEEPDEFDEYIIDDYIDCDHVC